MHLSFIKDPPMLHAMLRDGRIDHFIIFEVDIEVLLWDKTLYSNMNATTSDKELIIGDKLENLKEINFKVFDYD